MPLRALGRGGEGTGYDVLQAVRFAAGLDNDSGTVPARPADIINLSLGSEGFSAVAEALYAELQELGITVVAAAGNEQSRSPSFPAAYDSVVSVSAVDAQRRLTDYSNFGSSIMLAAPGGDSAEDLTGDGYPDGVLSTSAADGEFAYVFVSGTSMAAPHVAGVFALMKSINPRLTAVDIDNLLRNGELSDDLGDPGRDERFGFGLINARKAAEAALRSIGQPVPDAPRLNASTGVLNFGSNREALELVLSGSGGAEVRSVRSSVSWATVAPLQVDTAGLGSYRVRIDRSALPTGVVSGQIEVSSNSNNLQIQLLATSGSATRNDLGTVYVLLYDPAADDVVAQTSTRLSADGSYPFTLPPAPAGRYRVVAGTDLDNDLTICDAGEACGALLTVEQPQLLEIDADRDDLEFPLEYQIAIPNIAARAQAAPESVLPLSRP
jgi:serine protease